jgi:hypothetical protein
VFSPPATAPFRWHDGERIVLFGRDRINELVELREPGYELLTTPRAASTAPSVLEAAAAVHEVGPGRVDELAAELAPKVGGTVLLAMGGGRVIDVAKALATADRPAASRLSRPPWCAAGTCQTGSR